MSRRLGDEAEERAVRHLIEHGFTIVTRNASSRHGELDIVALEDDQLVFVEVKLRRSGVAEEAVTPEKGRRLRLAAQDYLQGIGDPERSYRFDLIAIDSSGVRHHREVLQRD